MASDVIQASAEATVQAARDAGGDGIAITVGIAEYGRIDGPLNVAAHINPVAE